MPSATRSKPASTPTATAKTLPLSDCEIALTGNFPNYSQADLLSLVATLGAKPVKSITRDATHLIATQNDFNKQFTKVAEAKNRGIFIVSLEWLLESEKANARQSELQYFLTSQPTGVPVSSKTNKRMAATSSPEPEPKKVKLDDSDIATPNSGGPQVTRNSSVQIPVDEGCSLTGYGVHVDDDGGIWDAALNQTNAGNNNNKFFRIQVLVGPSKHCQTWTRWGRVGERGQSKILGDGSMGDAIKNFEKKFREKSGLPWNDRMAAPKKGKYVYVERSYEPDDEDGREAGNDDAAESSTSKIDPTPASTLSMPVQNLMELIFNQQYFADAMSDMNYDAKKMPLGKLSKAMMMRGYETLKAISAKVSNPIPVANEPTIEELSNLFYSYIPHAFGRNRPPIISTQFMVKREIELLDNLADMKDAANIMKTRIDAIDSVHPLDHQYHALCMQEMTPLLHESSEHQLLEQYLMQTRGHTHSADYKVETIFRIERQGENTRFDASPFAGPVRDRRLLWHGSRVTNFGGILSQGLRIAPPEAPVSGYMFGKGIYLADMSSKSAGYCASYLSGGTALLLLCEAELGNPMQELVNADYDAGDHAKAKGAWSTWGKGSTGPSQWEDASCIHESLRGAMIPSTKQAPPGPTAVPGACLQYNEYICYDVAQVRLRYLFRVKMD